MKAFFISILYISVLQRLGKERNILLPKLLFPPEDTEPPLFAPGRLREPTRVKRGEANPTPHPLCMRLLVSWVTSAVALQDAFHHPLEGGEVRNESSASD